jgi:hypothetical protein
MILRLAIVGEEVELCLSELPATIFLLIFDLICQGDEVFFAHFGISYKLPSLRELNGSGQVIALPFG